MAHAADTYGTVLKNGSVTLLARVVDKDGAIILPADLASAEYSVYLLDDQDADRRTPIEGHAGVALSVADVVFDTLQNDAMWTVDEIGYNLRHVLDVSQHPAFAIAGRRYLVEHALTPTSGQVILVRFRLNAI